jgi:hypothetical protein
LGGVLLLVVAAGLIVLDAYYQAYQVAAQLEPITGDLNKARLALSRGKLPEGDPMAEAVDLAAEARDGLATARWTLRLVDGIPLVNRPIEVVQHQVSAATEWARASTIMRDMLVSVLGDKALQTSDLQSLESLQEEPEAPPIMADGKVDVSIVANLTPMLEEVITHLEAANQAIVTMPDLPFPRKLADFKDRAVIEGQAGITDAQNALAGIRLLPSFLGADGPKTYFVALQNSADQRGTGGAVLAYAILEVDDGQFTLKESGGIEDIDNEDQGIRGVALPPAVQWYIDAARVNPRLANGANYSPNFPVVASAWAAMVEKVTDEKIDGVIALDPTAIAYALGPRTAISIADYPDPITSANALYVIANDQYRLEKAIQEVIPGELITAAWPKLRQPSPFVRTMTQLGVGLAEKHIQLWSRDPDLEALIIRLNWDGGLDAGTGDYLFLAHNKRNGNKVDYYLKQDITYDVTIQPDGGAESTYTVTLAGDLPTGEPPPIAGREGYGLNVAMENLYVPLRATFDSVEPTAPITYDSEPKAFVQHEEGEFLVFTRPVQVYPDKPKTIVFTYSVPHVVQSSAEGNVYTLVIQHQAMINAPHMTVNVTLPEGSVPVPAEGWTVNGNVATWIGDLTQDVTLSLAF